MHDENSPIGDPQPVAPSRLKQFVKGATTAVAISLGTFVALALFLSPRRISGATCSARLKWQERQREQTNTAAPNTTTAPATAVAESNSEKDP